MFSVYSDANDGPGASRVPWLVRRAVAALEAIDTAQDVALTKIEAALGELVEATDKHEGVSENDRRHCVEVIREAVAEMLYDARRRVERDL